jgi:hypothetical protein
LGVSQSAILIACGKLRSGSSDTIWGASKRSWKLLPDGGQSAWRDKQASIEIY